MLTAIAAFTLLTLHTPANAKSAPYFYKVAIEDPSATLSKDKKALLLANLHSTILIWRKAITMKGSLKILVKMEQTPVGRIDGASRSNIQIGTRNGVPVYEEGAAHAIRTGTNLLKGGPDIIVRINPHYLLNEAWLDPRPLLRIDPVPRNKIDFISLLVHELAHSFGFNGFINQDSGELNPEILSLFDTFIKRDSSGVYFTGPNAVRVYGRAIPLTPNNYYHYGTASSSALLTGSMNGISYIKGVRYTLGPIDLAILQDLGLRK